MADGMQNRKGRGPTDQYRRKFLERLGILGAAATGAAVLPLAQPAWGGATLSDAFADFFQKHYLRMSSEEIARGRIWWLSRRRSRST